jgi:uncharacterized BrkB/YihY/UPF0761 family membrane protein
MKTTKLITAIALLIMSVYFWIMRFDVVQRIFEKGAGSADIGTLLLPLLLLVTGIILLYPFLKKEKDESTQKK